MLTTEDNFFVKKEIKFTAGVRQFHWSRMTFVNRGPLIFEWTSLLTNASDCLSPV